ncbi:MAG TPA: nitrile hydratase subunit beta [Gemmatimonadaceae bacterium]|nr:nitrile hydratase subunit beta [Gemmatimonadaceae bacterium]
MNGVHDMGGMEGFGPIAPEPNEPVFHHRWEARALALTLAVGAWGRWTLDQSRHARERIPAADYLRMSYYEKWVAGLVALLVESGLVTRKEIEDAHAAPGAKKSSPRLTVDRVAVSLASGGPTLREIAATPRFAKGAVVRARNLHPSGHTRLPRYVRGRIGTITRHHGAHVFPDTNAHGLGEQPQHLYQVRFETHELWGSAQQNAVYLDLWESYLEPA